MDQKQVNSEQLSELLKTASGKLNIPEKDLMNKLKSGNIPSDVVNQALKDPDKINEILNSPKAQAMLKKLMGKG